MILRSLILLLAAPLFAADGAFTIPLVTGRPGTQPFAGHPGWVDAHHAGHGAGVAARIGADARFSLPAPPKAAPICLIAMFDRIETPPVIIPNYRAASGGDVLIPTEYACAPAGYPEVWDREYLIRGKDFFQTFVPQCTQLYGVSVFDGPKFVSWGNKINVSVHEEGPRGKLIMVTEGGEGPSEHVTAGRSDKELPRIGWRHAGLPVAPGKAYAIRAGAYRHGGSHFRLDGYIRPDRGDGYAEGSASLDGKPLDGDLCCLVFGNGNGQLVENHIRSEEWEIFIPHHPPSSNWAQSFTAHGVSLAGISFWVASDKEPGEIACQITIHPDGIWENPIGPRKVAAGHESPARPIIRYPEIPKPLPGHERWYKLPSLLFQVAYLPDELPLEPGRTYLVQLAPSRPIMLYADGDYYPGGHAFYEGLKVDRQREGLKTFHSCRWTLCMNIVTYARPGE